MATFFKTFHAVGSRRLWVIVIALLIHTSYVQAVDEQQLFERAQAAEKTGQWRIAEANYRYLIKQNSGISDYHYRLAVILFRRGDTAASQDALVQALALDANYPPALMMQAAQKQQAGEVADAITLYEQVLSADDTYLQAVDHLITLYEELGDEEKLALYQAQRTALINSQ